HASRHRHRVRLAPCRRRARPRPQPLRPALPATASATASATATAIASATPEACVVRQPIDVVLALDVSHSMAGAPLEQLKQAALDFIAQIDMDQDRVAIVAFSDEAELLLGLTNDPAELNHVITTLMPQDGTDIAAGIRAAGAHLHSVADPERSRALILFSDGQIKEPTDHDDAIGAVKELDEPIALFTVGLGDEVNKTLMHDLAGDRGQAYFAPTPDDLAQIYRSIAAELTCS
ncbi:MAG: VWA domain-containing protein, partial [Oscillochloris sp.]|nr:VWA domain-containing protein [Oscillochloris sp.]